MSDRAFTHESFQHYLEEHKLMGTRCQNCATLYLPPRPLCPNCYNEQLAWELLSGKGVLAAFTALHIGPRSMQIAGYDRKNPYCSGIVHLEEGPAISAQILGLDVVSPENNQIGAPLQVIFVDRDQGEDTQTILAFEVQ
jgi:uncharacterized OB-fold protein